MSWKEQLTKLENTKNWTEAIQLLRNVIEEDSNESEPFIRMIYLLHNLLLEEDYQSLGFYHDDVAKLLMKYFQMSSHKFENDAEYLFFIGIILHIAEWYFNQDDVQLALQMQKRATVLNPRNKLFKFSYEFSMSNKGLARFLANELLHDKDNLQWLESKGFPGQYVLGLLQTVQDRNIWE